MEPDSNKVEQDKARRSIETTVSCPRAQGSVICETLFFGLERFDCFCRQRDILMISQVCGSHVLLPGEPAVKVLKSEGGLLLERLPDRLGNVCQRARGQGENG